ncbi:MAG: thiol:disulfide interchange protein DsbA/DsbL [Pseudohongiellaceae bacterium]
MRALLHIIRRAALLAAMSALVPMAATPLQAQPLALEAGRDFVRIEPALVTDSGAERIEVLDVFWYGCPVCREFAPMMSYWGGEIRGDLVMRRMPAIWNEVMRLHARIHFTGVALQLEAQVHEAAFRYIHEQQQALNTEAQARKLFTTLGVTDAAFTEAWNSPEVETALQRAERDTQAAGIDRLPALVVNGRYRVVRNQSLRELPDLVVATNELIKRERDLRRAD